MRSSTDFGPDPEMKSHTGCCPLYLPDPSAAWNTATQRIGCWLRKCFNKALACLLLATLSGNLLADEPLAVPRCQVLPLPEHQVSFQIDGVEKSRWHFGGQYPRPFFYPFCGPSGASLTRMGHPGAQNHDHHRSVWLAHHDVGGIDFWSDHTDSRVRQKHWYCYSDDDNEAVMASALAWVDGEGKPLMEQDLVAALIPLDEGEHALEIQITMRPPTESGSVELGKTNFGFLAVRVAKTISVYFGGGKLTSSEGQEGEQAIFGQRARWMDYSGPIAVGSGPNRQMAVEGITYFDHPSNPRYPTHWHVREDGWMGASLCMHEGLTVTASTPLTLRYLLHAHRGAYSYNRAETIHRRFAQRPGFQIAAATERHQQYEVKRKAKTDTGR
jgi:hypothetical protein